MEKEKKMYKFVVYEWRVGT